MNEIMKYDYTAHEGKGFEGQTREDVLIPFLLMLQGQSPQVVEKSVKGAEAGKLFNSVTEQLYDEVDLVAGCTRHEYVEWIPRDQGGGFVAVHALDSDVVKAAKAAAKEFGKLNLPNGNQLVETFYVFGIPCTAEGQPEGFVVVPFTSTKIKIYRQWNTRLQIFMVPTTDGRKLRPPLYAHLTRVSRSELQRNEKGQWYNPVLRPARGEVMNSLLDPNDPRFKAGADCAKLIQSGAFRVAYETSEADTAGDEKLPF